MCAFAANLKCPTLPARHGSDSQRSTSCRVVTSDGDITVQFFAATGYVVDVCQRSDKAHTVTIGKLWGSVAKAFADQTSRGLQPRLLLWQGEQCIDLMQHLDKVLRCSPP